jgi:TP53 regulating kinase and related kinases
MAAADQPPPPHDPRSLLPTPFNHTTEPMDLIAQGAESLLYRTTFLTPTTPAALKFRLKKQWRHPILDKRLTRARILAEARVLVRLSGEGVASGMDGKGKVKGKKIGPSAGGEGDRPGGRGGRSMRGCVPRVLGLDWEAGWLALEWIEGGSVKEGIRRVSGKAEELQRDEALRSLLRRLGNLVGRLHLCEVVHGDLTTSNVMLRRPKEEGIEGEQHGQRNGAETGTEAAAATALETFSHDLVLIDFGLATQSGSDEDRAVDLYVLERAFGSTHPREEQLFPVLLEGYEEAMGKAGKVVLRRLEDVRMRGRKKSMLG